MTEVKNEFRLPSPGEKYLHYKGGKYEVLYNGTHTETGELMVVLRNVQFKSVSIRPLSSFNSFVFKMNEREPMERFTLVVDKVKGPNWVVVWDLLYWGLCALFDAFLWSLARKDPFYSLSATLMLFPIILIPVVFSMSWGKKK